jgi:glutamyl-Q tRNA(Asp) synthetase
VTAPAASTADCGRFAPSPTGPLHFGSLVAALASWCDARLRQGRWLVRIEDVDTPRARPGVEDDILATLARHGLQSDGPVVRQSERAAFYANALAQLGERGLTFACACTRRELASASRPAPNASGERIYPGTCRHGVPASRASRPRKALRVHVDDTVIDFVDRLQGSQRQDLATDVGDFIVRRSDGVTAYQLAVVVDDAAQGISDVVRGADLLLSTPRQVFLQRLLGLPEPRYLHLPVAVNARGEKLSKQTGARALTGPPLPALEAAWQFLRQPEPAATLRDVAGFLAYAEAAWSPARLPCVEALPCPAAFA